MFEHALEANPRDHWLTATMADICASLWEALTSRDRRRANTLGRKEEEDVALVFSQRANRYFQQALKMRSDCCAVQHKYSRYLVKNGKFYEAEKWIVAALKLLPEGDAASGDELQKLLQTCQQAATDSLAASVGGAASMSDHTPEMEKKKATPGSWLGQKMKRFSRSSSGNVAEEDTPADVERMNELERNKLLISPLTSQNPQADLLSFEHLF